MGEFVLALLLSFVLMLLGWNIWKNQNLSLLHCSHYRNVKEEDISAYATEIGIAIIIIGIGIMLAEIIDYATSLIYGWHIFMFNFITSIILIAHAQRKYNS